MSLEYKIISSPGAIDTQIRDFIAAYDHDFYPTISSRRDLADFVQSVYNASGKFVICFDGNKIAGLTSVYLDHPTFITYYHYIAIDKSYRGKGISTTLYNYVHQICRDHGVQWAIVKTWSTNKVSQAMFKKHGFFHLYTLEDDRSKGVHTYFYAKSFSADPFKNSITGLALIGNMQATALCNFMNTVSRISTINGSLDSSLPFMVLNSETDSAGTCTKAMNASHLLCLAPGHAIQNTAGNIALIDIYNITKQLVEERSKKWMLVAETGKWTKEFSGISNLTFPGADSQTKIQEIIAEVSSGKVSAAYYKEDIVSIAVQDGYDGVVLGMPELHTMFGFDKMLKGIELFDPWLELAILIENNRTNFKFN